MTEMSREKIIIRTSVTGIAANIFLAAFKAFVGFLSPPVTLISTPVAPARATVLSAVVW